MLLPFVTEQKFWEALTSVLEQGQQAADRFANIAAGRVGISARLRDVVITALARGRHIRRDRDRRLIYLLLGQEIRERAPNTSRVDGKLYSALYRRRVRIVRK
jgi:hypothetical protein